MMAQETLAVRLSSGKNRSRRASDTYPDEDRHQAPSLLRIHPLSLQNVAEQLGE
jgi:hypothetical protein